MALLAPTLLLPASAMDNISIAAGRPSLTVASDSIRLENNAISVSWQLNQNRLSLNKIKNDLARTTIDAGAPLFFIEDNQGTFSSSALELVGQPSVEDILPNSGSDTRASLQSPGKRVVAHFRQKENRFQVIWSAQLREGATYLQQSLRIEPGPHTTIRNVRLIDLSLPNAKLMGSVDGSPVTSDHMFFSIEHPMSQCRIVGGRVLCDFKPPVGNQPFEVSSVIGAAYENQFRRAFLNYIERERAHPYRPFLHYNSWYHTGWGASTSLNAPPRLLKPEEMNQAIKAVGTELAIKRKIQVDAFVFDDGWDNPKTVWKFHEKLPNGFSAQKDLVNQYGSSLGTWISPCGGYLPSKAIRLDCGKREGYETNANGFSLAGPRYYERFFNTCDQMMESYNLGYVKFDGFGHLEVGKDVCGPDPQNTADVNSLLRLINDLRKEQPTVFINTTVGTWPSPFWLWYSDSVWRSGLDVGFQGEGSSRERWLTYRDAITYQKIVSRAPAFPLNSLMIHGVLITEPGNGIGEISKLKNDLPGLKHEIRSFFASGTGVQELYISPEALTKEIWDLIAEVAAWSRKNSDVLVDSHWIGGNPAKNEIYGFASWNPRKGIIALRNPSSKPVNYMLDLNQAFELPPSPNHKRYKLVSPWSNEDVPEMDVPSGQRPISLAPFEVLVLEAIPDETQ